MFSYPIADYTTPTDFTSRRGVIQASARLFDNFLITRILFSLGLFIYKRTELGFGSIDIHCLWSGFPVLPYSNMTAPVYLVTFHNTTIGDSSVLTKLDIGDESINREFGRDLFVEPSIDSIDTAYHKGILHIPWPIGGSNVFEISREGYYAINALTRLGVVPRQVKQDIFGGGGFTWYGSWYKFEQVPEGNMVNEYQFSFQDGEMKITNKRTGKVVHKQSYMPEAPNRSASPDRELLIDS